MDYRAMMDTEQIFSLLQMLHVLDGVDGTPPPISTPPLSLPTEQTNNWTVASSALLQQQQQQQTHHQQQQQLRLQPRAQPRPLLSTPTPPAQPLSLRRHSAGSGRQLARVGENNERLQSEILRKYSRRPSRPVVCVFCKQNGESEAFYRGHTLKDGNGDVVCPVLQRYVCPICNATGPAAHTIKYCPVGTGVGFMRRRHADRR